MFTYPKVLGALGVIGIAIAAYFYITGLQNEVITLTKDNTELNVSNDTLTQDKQRTKESLSETKQNLSTVNRKFAKAQAEREAIMRLFGDHDFTKLLRAKPEWMSKKMSEGTRRVLREIEKESN